mmetsp:Transcript_33081/g.102677  ORF Transcript_33081/g.102677 Transcript_33081/m.102677 type:complete len:231 (+) Transcript_33081:927-1619(+)
MVLDEDRGLAREDYGKDKDDEPQQYQGPDEVGRGVCDHERQEAQLLEESEDTKHTDNPQHLDGLHACADGARAATGGDDDHEVHNGQGNQGQVKEVPTPVPVAEVALALHVHPHDELDEEEEAAGVPADHQEGGLLEVSLGLLVDLYAYDHGVQHYHDGASGVEDGGLHDALHAPALRLRIRLERLPLPRPGSSPLGGHDDRRVGLGHPLSLRLGLRDLLRFHRRYPGGS